MNRLFSFFLFSMAVLSCNSPKMKVDLIVTKAKVYTVNQSFTVAESFAVKDGKFLAVGTNGEINSAYVSDQVINCAGRPVFPGFEDAHCHFFGYGMNLMEYVNLAGTKDLESIYKKLQEHFVKTNGEWLLGRGWDQNLWPEKSFPDNNRLNELFPDVPVYLVRIDGHAAWCNKKALELAGIDRKSVV